MGEKPELDFLFTVDLEYDYGSGGTGKTNHILPFLRLANDFFKEHALKATLFVQGNLVEPASSGLRGLGTVHEIGLHGYAHEPWGASWFVKDRVPSPAQRKILISKSLNAFQDAGFQKPVSFRAPNMVIDAISSKLLEDAGFKVDSSYPSYAGGMPLAKNRHGLVEVPVSFDPKPVFGKFLRSRYVVFNTHNLATGEFDASDAAIRIVKSQMLAGQKPFLVFLCHPWEFFEADEGMDQKQFGYSSPRNIKLVEDTLAVLKKSFVLRPLTLREFIQERPASSQR